MKKWLFASIVTALVSITSTAVCNAQYLSALGLRVPAGFEARKETSAESYTKTGWAKEIVEKATGMEFVFIPAGEFDMGGTWKWGMHEMPVHHVQITKPFYLGKYQVTRGQWQSVMGRDLSATVQVRIGYSTQNTHAVSLAAPWKTHAGKIDGEKGVDEAMLPAATGSWEIADIFLKKMSQKTGGIAMRMPTEAEYEYACRAGTKTEFFYGNDAYAISPKARSDLKNNCTELIKYAWYDNLWQDYQWTGKLPPEEKAIQHYHAVGELLPNPWGLYDIMGNLWHWCSDWFGDDYYAECASKGTVNDPKGPESTPLGLRVIRGGYPWHPAWYCRSAFRDHYRPDVDWGYAGLRLVVEIGNSKEK